MENANVMSESDLASKRNRPAVPSGRIIRDSAVLAVSAASLLASICLKGSFSPDPAWLCVVLCGIPIIAHAAKGIVTSLDIKADVLVSIALVASIVIGEVFAAAEVAFIMRLGSALEEFTLRKARNGIEALVKLRPRTARIISDGMESVVSAESISKGDILRVLPGETIPADGVIIEGFTSVDQSIITGESIPVDRKVGDTVTGGSVNCYGSFDMCAQRVGEESTLQRMIRLVESADVSRAKIVRTADRWATWIVAAALTGAVACYFITSDIVSSVTVLVVFCPCCMVLATPTAITAAIGNLTKRGVLVRSGDALERMAEISTVGLDKTGTLTEGRPELISAESFDDEHSREDIITLAAAAERRSEHPLAKAVVRSYGGDLGELPEVSDFSMMPGKGVEGTVDGKHVMVGNADLFNERKIPITDRGAAFARWLHGGGCSMMYVSLEGKCIGAIGLADRVRPEALESIDRIRSLGVSPVLITGDNREAARSVAKQLGINTFHAECLPETKLAIIEESQENGRKICMVGDGVNDAPALKASHVGIAMGREGSDIAVEVSDITLGEDSVRQLPYLIALARDMMKTIRLNLAFSLILNFAAIALAFTGILTPVTGALVHNAGSILVILWSVRLLGWNEDRVRFGLG